jgi:hypothetical protein
MATQTSSHRGPHGLGPIPDVRPERIAAALEQAGLPPATSVEPVGQVWVHANFKIALQGGGAVLLRCRLVNPGWDTLLNEMSALSRAPKALPKVRAFHSLPAGLFGCPAAFATWIAGQDAQALATDERGRMHLSRIIGSTIGSLQVRRFDDHGTVGTGSGFVPRAPTWREEWTLAVEEAWASASAAGATLGHAGDALMGRIRSELPALDAVTGDFSLVHRDLHGGNLRLRSDGSLAAVIDWSDSLIGDPQLEWAPLREAPDPYFDAMHEAAGRPPIDRVPFYDASRQIQRLAFTTLPLFDRDRGVLRALTLERVRHGIRRLEGHPVSAPTPDEVAIRRAVEGLRHVPGVRPQVAMAWLGGVAAALLGDDWLTFSDPLLSRVDLQDRVRPYGAATREQVAERVLSGLPESPVGALAVALVALTCEADDRLDHTLGERVWAGLAEAVEGLLWTERDLELPQRDRGWHALLGRAACRVLGSEAHAARFPAGLTPLPERPAAGEPLHPRDAILPALTWAQAQLG